MPVVCGLCDKPFEDDDWGWFTPDEKEWNLLTEEQQGICSLVGKLMVHRKCYDSLYHTMRDE